MTQNNAFFSLSYLKNSVIYKSKAIMPTLANERIFIMANIITTTLSAQDKNCVSFRANIAKHVEACQALGQQHNTVSLKEFKQALKKSQPKIFSSVYEGDRPWKNAFSAVLFIGKFEGDFSGLFIEASDKLAEMGKPCRVFSYEGAKTLVNSYVNGTGKFADKSAEGDDAEGDDAEGEDDSVQTLDNSDKRTAAEIAQNFFDIAEASKYETADILAEFSKLVKAKENMKAEENTGFVDANIKIAS